MEKEYIGILILNEGVLQLIPYHNSQLSCRLCVIHTPGRTDIGT